MVQEDREQEMETMDTNTLCYCTPNLPWRVLDSIYMLAKLETYESNILRTSMQRLLVVTAICHCVHNPGFCW